MRVNQIISETIHRYIANIINEAEESDYQKSMRHSQELKRQRGNNLAPSDEENLRQKLQNDNINVAAIAREVYPDLTDGGAQSQLQKKIDGKLNDEGSEYHLTSKEASIINRELDSMGIS